jgi:subtilisin family serine protease
MSLGRAAAPGEAPSLVYERLGRRALERGCLILAAAGNDSARGQGIVAPVGAPANSPSILAVGALGPALDPAPFSNGGIDEGTGGAVDLAGPGVDVFSAAPRPRLYRALSGTSMACPHAAGAAALLAQSDPALRGRALWDALVAGARPLPYPSRDVGAGLVRAPTPDPGAPDPGGPVA